MTNPRKYLWVVAVSLALLAVGCTRFGNSSRPDAQVTADVQNKINSDANVPDKQLSVNASNGVVTLSGNVGSDFARNAAANAAAQVEGVKTVVNNLQVTPDNANADAANTLAAKPAPWNPPSQPAATQEPAPPAPAAPQKITIPSGTQLSIRLNEEVNSEKAQVGDTFHGSLAAPVTIDGQTVIPTTADVEGRVVEVKSAGRFAGQSVLTLQLTRLIMNGKSYSLQTDQWSHSGSGRGKATAAKVGGGAAVGAILGGIFGGGKGAAIGGVAGAGAGTGVSAATKGQQIILKPEAVIDFQLQNSLTVTPAASRHPLGQ